MAKKRFKIAAETKAEIINKIKYDGVSVVDAAKQYGISDKCIYNWLGTKASSTISVLEYNKRRKKMSN